MQVKITSGSKCEENINILCVPEGEDDQTSDNEDCSKHNEDVVTGVTPPSIVEHLRRLIEGNTEMSFIRETNTTKTTSVDSSTRWQCIISVLPSDIKAPGIKCRRHRKFS